MENIKLNGISVGEVLGIVRIGRRPLSVKNFIVSNTVDIKLISFIVNTRYRGHKRNKVITACSNTSCNFFEIENKVIKGGMGVIPIPKIIQIDDLSYLKFEIFQTSVMLWSSSNLVEWEPIGPILKGTNIGTLDIIQENNKILLWFSSYENHEELNYKEAWLVHHASLNISKIKEVMYNK